MSVAAARRIAAAHPAATLPCPVCAAAVKAANLERHLDRVHPGAPERSSFPGRLGARLAIDGGTLRVRGRLGLLRRAVALAGPVEVGTLTHRQIDPATAALYADQLANPPAEDVKRGTYVRLGDRLTIGCRGGTGLRAHWEPEGWRQGPKRRRTAIVVGRDALVAIEYALAERGTLRPRT